MNVVSCEWLHSRLTEGKQNNIKVLDASWLKDGVDYEANYKQCHIPSAVYCNTSRIAIPTKHVPIMVPNKEDFQSYVRSLGINSDSHVVVYEKTQWKYPMTSVRTWWMFKYFDHDNVSVLNGGMWEWERLGYPVESDTPEVQAGNFTAKERAGVWKSYEDMQSIVNGDTENTTVVDVRNTEFFNGEIDEPNIFIRGTMQASGFDVNECTFHKGHMPNAVSVSYEHFLEAEKDLTTIRSKQECGKAFAERGVDLSKPVVFTCHMGLTACTGALMAEQLGCQNWAVYPGSWIEWGQRSSEEQCVSKL